MTDWGLRHDLTAWRNLVRRVARATRRPADAEDLLHSAFLRLEEYRSRHVVENPESIHDLVDLWDHRPLHDEVLVAHERLERVDAALGRLGTRTREVFLMHRVDGLKYREIAVRLGITVSAVEKHVAKAALSLVECMEDS